MQSHFPSLSNGSFSGEREREREREEEEEEEAVNTA